jgi:hypothetical protein
MNLDKDLSTTLKILVGKLEQLKVRYHLTGGLISSFYGEPRFTQDIDIVVALDLEDGERLVKAFRPEFLINEEAVSKNINLKKIFQALHNQYLIKVDFHVGEGIPGELDRSVKKELLPGFFVNAVCKEDAMLSKLLWVKAGSGKSREDVVAMLKNPLPFDLKLVEEKAEALGVLDILKEIEQ